MKGERSMSGIEMLFSNDPIVMKYANKKCWDVKDHFPGSKWWMVSLCPIIGLPMERWGKRALCGDVREYRGGL
jgi:hypothetical protein